MANQEKQQEDRPPEAFRDLTPEVRRRWASQPETQLFLRLLEEDRETAVNAALLYCAPSGGSMNEHRVACATESRSLAVVIGYITEANNA